MLKKRLQIKNTQELLIESLKDEVLELYRKLENKSELYLLTRMKLEEKENKIKELLEENEKLRKKKK